MDNDKDTPTSEQMEARYHAALAAMTPEARVACLEVINWMAFERPKDTPAATQEEMQKWPEVALT